MKPILEGLRKFQREVFPLKRDLFRRLAEGQRPETLFIGCSDSRVDPNLLTSTEPGELFVLRNAGNVVPPYGASTGGEAAAVEYAVQVLGVDQIIVCGHTHCGAVKALLDPEAANDLPSCSARPGSKPGDRCQRDKAHPVEIRLRHEGARYLPAREGNRNPVRRHAPERISAREVSPGGVDGDTGCWCGNEQ